MFVKRIAKGGAAAAVLALALAGCGLVSADAYTSTLQLEDLVIRDSGGRYRGYVEVVGGVDSAYLFPAPLKVAAVPVADIPDDLAWLRDFDLDGDETVGRREMVQAWLVKIAEMLSGETFEPDSLRVLVGMRESDGDYDDEDRAALIDALPSGGELKGLELSPLESRFLREHLEARRTPEIDAIVRPWEDFLDRQG